MGNWKEIILNIGNKIFRMLYMISLLSIILSLFGYIVTDSFKFQGFAWISLILAMVFGKLELKTMDELLKLD